MLQLLAELLQQSVSGAISQVHAALSTRVGLFAALQLLASVAPRQRSDEVPNDDFINANVQPVPWHFEQTSAAALRGRASPLARRKVLTRRDNIEAKLFVPVEPV